MTMHYAEKKLKSFTCFLSTILIILTVLCPVTGNSNELNEQQLTNKLFGAVLINNISEFENIINEEEDINILLDIQEEEGDCMEDDFKFSFE